jgi:alkanesulfonate monooxygenase SsuD/methylene tetrahydromethanopterin reductase-like flavin-dependent oxidoreductase (luciferase family)
MRLGIHFVNFAPPAGQEIGSVIAQAAAVADTAGAAMFSLPDHFLGVGDAHSPFLECYTSLGFLAGQTSAITLSALVTGVTYRHAGALAKTVSTLDVLTQGRAMLGVGVGWYERGHTALGLPFPPVRERFDILEETLDVCTQMFSADDGPYVGTHHLRAQTAAAHADPSSRRGREANASFGCEVCRRMVGRGGIARRPRTQSGCAEETL